MICETPIKSKQPDEPAPPLKSGAKKQKIAGVDAAELLDAANETAAQITVQVCISSSKIES